MTKLTYKQITDDLQEAQNLLKTVTNKKAAESECLRGSSRIA